MKKRYFLAGLLLATLFLNTVLFPGFPLLPLNPKSNLERTAQVHVSDAPNLPTSLWVELGDNSQAIARVITEAPICPAIAIDSRLYPMVGRGQPSDSFPVLVCEYAIPATAKSVQVAGQSLPLPKSNPQRIAVIGDTGCRLKGKQIQACNDPNQWPFPKIAETIAAWKPDLVIHVGDYLYRETPCPKHNSGCAGSAAGDFWRTWDEDFFTPASSLLRTAPWILARGNHELCNRGGTGWFYLLDPRSQPGKCQDYTDLYKVSLGSTDVIVMDSALADDAKAVSDQVAVYEPQFQQMQTLAQKPTWLLVHRPIWGIGQSRGKPPILYVANKTLQAASNNRLPEAISLILSGHIHVFEMLDFADQRPPQSITGNTGTALDAAVSPPIEGASVGGTTVVHGASIGKFGYMTLERQETDRWLGTARGVDGSVQANCLIQARQVVCHQPVGINL